jgi:hemerythrin-like domain-containing protein
MYVIDTSGPGFDRPLELLEACHGRIEDRLAMLEHLVAHLAQRGADADAREAARLVLRFFDTVGEQHHRDEDDDLFPRLRSRAAELGRPEIAAVIDELERDHDTMRLQWSRLRALLDMLARNADASLIDEDIVGFCWLYRRHMARESAAILPFAREALDALERGALGERMAARRRHAA